AFQLLANNESYRVANLKGRDTRTPSNDTDGGAAILSHREPQKGPYLSTRWCFLLLVWHDHAQIGRRPHFHRIEAQHQRFLGVPSVEVFLVLGFGRRRVIPTTADQLLQLFVDSPALFLPNVDGSDELTTCLGEVSSLCQHLRQFTMDIDGEFWIRAIFQCAAGAREREIGLILSV